MIIHIELISIHSHQHYDKRPLQVVIRNSHSSSLRIDIISFLSELRHQVTHVHDIKAFLVNDFYLYFSSILKCSTRIHTKSNNFCTPKQLSENLIHPRVHLNTLAVSLRCIRCLDVSDHISVWGKTQIRCMHYTCHQNLFPGIHCPHSANYKGCSVFSL